MERVVERVSRLPGRVGDIGDVGVLSDLAQHASLTDDDRPIDRGIGVEIRQRCGRLLQVLVDLSSRRRSNRPCEKPPFECASFTSEVNPSNATRSSPS